MKGAIGLAVIVSAAVLCGGCERADQGDQGLSGRESAPRNNASAGGGNAEQRFVALHAVECFLSNPTVRRCSCKNWEPQALSPNCARPVLPYHARRKRGDVADISFVLLRACGFGNVLDNVNRWLGLKAYKQPAVSEEKLKSMIQVALSTPRGNVAVVDLSGEPENGDLDQGRSNHPARWPRTRTAWGSSKCAATRPWSARRRENFLKWVMTASRSARRSAPQTSGNDTVAVGERQQA